MRPTLSVACRKWQATVAASLAIVISIASLSKATVYSYSAVGAFGTLNQRDAQVTGPQALRDNSCVPTSVTNGLLSLTWIMESSW